jgi:SIR2-like domain
MSVTAFIGAGAVLDIGGPTTSCLTNAVKRLQQWKGDLGSNATVPAIQQIANALDNYYAPNTANFEDIFHAIESLISLQTGLTPKTAKEYKPAIGAFVSPNAAAAYTPIVLRGALTNIVDEVARQVTRYVSDFQPTGAHKWFVDFWRSATDRQHWDIGTLNYDNCIEQSLIRNTWEDGFYQIDPGIHRFDPAQIVNSTLIRILHLHGSVFFGYPHPNVSNRFAYEDEHEDIYRFDSISDARQLWFGRSTNHSQAGESAIAGPIITGQRKPDKLLGYPYSTYQTVLHDVLLNNPRLLIAGYGFGDLHFNRLLSRLTRIHRDNRRVVLIAWVPPDNRGDNWMPYADVTDWLGIQARQVLLRLSRQDYPLQGQYVNPWISRDGLCRVYLEGFQNAVQNHGAEIVNFLTT